MSNNTHGQSQDLINFRVFIEKIFRKIWIIVGISLAAIITAAILTLYVLPPEYSAASYVTLTQPLVSAELDPAIQVSPNLPDAQGLSELAEAESITLKALEASGITVLSGGRLPDMKADLLGSGQIELKVKGPDPEKVTRIANEWSNILISRLNNLYGVGELNLEEIKQEVEQARMEWYANQEALESFLPESNLEVNQIELRLTMSELESKIQVVEELQKIVSDASILRNNLQDYAPGSNLRLNDALGLIALQQRAWGGIHGLDLNLETPELFGEDFSGEEALDSLELFVSSLRTQIDDTQADITELEVEVNQLSTAVESGQHQLERLTQKRDLSRSSYRALSSQLEETRILAAQNSQFAKISAGAVVPSNAAGPSLVQNVILAAFVGLMIGVGYVLVIDWWKEG
jgi:capsular polysaccharide biosynthesis protein